MIKKINDIKNHETIKKNSGSTVIITMFVILFLMIIGFSMIYMMRNESQQAFNYVEATTAQYLAEAGIEQAMYLLFNNANDFTQDAINLGWNKKFATEKEFTLSVPKNFIDNFDARISDLNKTFDSEVTTKVPRGEVLSITVSYKLSEELDEFRKIGNLTIESVAKYNNIKRKVQVEKEIALFKDIPIQYDHALFVNNMKKEKLPSRRAKLNSKWWQKAVNFFAGKYVPQQFFVNGRIFYRNCVVELNKEADPTLSGILETKPSMIDKLASTKVDQYGGNTDLGLYHNSWLSSPVDEIDHGLLDGGSRGNTDLTGFDPLNSLEKIFKAIGFKPKKDTQPNQMYGNITRTYKYNNKINEEPYLTPPAGISDYCYHGAVENDPNLKAIYPEDKIIGVLEQDVYKRIAFRQRTQTTPVKYEIGNKTVTNNVVKYYGWGPWQAAPPSSGFFGPIKDLFKIKTGKEAALAYPKKYAIQLKGYEFVDGDVHIEGYYQGRGVIVATGNIYIGNELLRHRQDDTGIPFNYKYPDGTTHDGSGNSLQLVALGTRPSSDGSPSGKIVFRTTKDPNFAESNVFKEIFSMSDKSMQIQAFMYAKNGVESQFGDDSWFGNSENKMFTTVNGNLVAEKLDVTDQQQYLPDEFWLLEDRRWITMYDELKNSKDKIVVAITPKIKRYWQGNE